MYMYASGKKRLVRLGCPRGLDVNGKSVIAIKVKIPIAWVVYYCS